MKKTIPIILVYTLMIFAICMAVTFGYRPLPELIPGDVGKFRFFRGLWWFSQLLPSILVSGFAVACSVIWREGTFDSKKRFSPAMMRRFGGVMIASLIIVFILSVNQELGLPRVTRAYNDCISAPSDLRQAKDYARVLLDSDQPELAYQYALRAGKLCPNDADTQELLHLAQNAVDLARDKTLHGHDDRNVRTVEDIKPLYTKDRQFTVPELLEKSRAAAEDEEWFLSHYWASLAVQASSGVDASRQEAVTLANEAWKELNMPEGFDVEELADFYEKKMMAYEALQAGTVSDSLAAYYGFKSLAQSGHADDPDIIRFMALAQEAVENEYFFIDETDRIADLETGGNIYFSLKNPSTGMTDVYYIGGVMDKSEDGRSVRYLDGLTVVTYSKAGRFVRSLYAPMAKVISQPVSAFDEAARKEKGISEKWGSVPFIMLQAVDRETKGVVVGPRYSYLESGLPEPLLAASGMVDRSPVQGDEEVLEDTVEQLRNIVTRQVPESRTVVLPMPYEDFIAINNANKGPDGMDLLTLLSFCKKSAGYGFSQEVFSKNLLGRAAYPLFLLSVLIFAACIGWNYRIEESAKSGFKFWWVFLVPVYGVVTYLLLEVVNYLYDILNYVIVGAFGGAALPVILGVYVVLLFIMSITFLARRE
ncbi:MAG TPA: hypothetical protein DCM57_07215 [Treponema sp.]|nr:hypothetical protein [Treponema sp.]HBB42155.1 hypothetical protein [Treponema sp.]